MAFTGSEFQAGVEVSATLNIAAATRALTRALKQIEKALPAVVVKTQVDQGALRTAQTLARAIGREFNTVQQAVKTVNQEVSRTSSATRLVRDDIGKVVSGTKQWNTASKEVTKAVNSVTQQTRAAQVQTQRIANTFRNDVVSGVTTAAKGVRVVEDSIARATTAAGKLGTRAERVGQGLTGGRGAGNAAQIATALGTATTALDGLNEEGGRSTNIFARLTERFKGTGSAVDGVRKSTNDANGGFNELRGILARVEGQANRTRASFLQIAAAAGLASAGALAGFGAFAAAGIRSAAAMETLRISMTGFKEVLDPTNQDVETILNKLIRFAALTPFEVPGLTDSVIKLAGSFQFTIDQSLEFLRILGDAGAATGATTEQIQGAVLAITQIGARGKVSSQELNQLANAIPSLQRVKIFDEVAKIMKKTRGEAQALADQGLIPASVGIQAILNAAQQVPGAVGAMSRQAKTFNGIMSTLRDTMNQFLATAFNPVIQSFSKFLDPIVNGNKDLQGLATTIGTQLSAAFDKFLPNIVGLGAQIGQALQVGLNNLPAIAEGFGGIFTAAGQVIAALKPFIPVFARIINDAGNLARAVGLIAAPVARIAEAFFSLKPVIPIIEILLLRFVTMKVVIAIINSIRAAFIGLANVIDNILAPVRLVVGAFVRLAGTLIGLIPQFKGIGEAINNFGRSMQNLGQAQGAASKGINALASVVGSVLTAALAAATIAMQLYGDATAKAKKENDDLLASLNKGIDTKAFNSSADLLANAQKVAQKALEDSNKDYADFVQKRKGIGVLLGAFDLANAKIRQEAAKKEAKNRAQDVKNIEADIKARDEILLRASQVVSPIKAASTLTPEDIFGIAAKEGIDLTDLAEGTTISKDAQDRITKQVSQAIIKSLVDAGTITKEEAAKQGFEIGKSLVDAIEASAVPKSFDDLVAEIEKAAKPIEDLFSARQGVIDAQESVNDAVQREKEIRTELNKLIVNGVLTERGRAIQADELADAADHLLQIERSLRDLQQERDKLIRDEQRRQDDILATREALEDRILQNTVDVARATRARIQAEKELADAIAGRLPNEQVDVDLTGLSLDQIRQKLAAVRATLAAQKQGTTTNGEEETQAEKITRLQEDVTLAQIAERGAKRDTVDLQQEKTDLAIEEKEAAREYSEKLDEIKTQEASLGRDRLEAQFALNDLKNKESGITKTIKDLTEQLDDAKRAVTVAQNALNKAVETQREAEASIKQDAKAYLQAKIDYINKLHEQLPLEGQVLDAYNKQFDKVKAIGDELAKPVDKNVTIHYDNLSPVINPKLNTNPVDQQLADINKKINDTFINPTGSPLLQPGPGGLLSGLDVDDLLATAGNALLQAAKGISSITTGLNRGLNATPILPSYTGGYFPGHGDGRGEVRTIAEYGAEAVLPLTRQYDLQKVLHMPQVLNPILAALPRIKLPVPQGLPSLDVAKLSTQAATAVASRPVVMVGAPVQTERQKRKDNEALATAIGTVIAEKLQGAEGKDVIINVAPQSQDVELLIRRLKHELKRELNL